MTIDKEFESFLFSQDDGEMYSSAYRRAWQAARAIDAKRIAELEAQRNHWQNMAGKFANDEYIALEKLTQASVEIAELKAREKVLVEALNESIECFEQSARGFIPYEQALEKCKQALANMRGGK